jgi:hypothetical protein
MRKKLFIFGLLLSVILLSVTESRAAFPVKKETAAETVVNPPVATENTTAAASQEGSVIRTKKHSIFSNVVNRIINPRRATAMPPVAYVLLCIIALGWLAMGLNDNFAGFEWVLSLVLYILFYFPGLIYSLIMMGKYY